MAVPKTEILVTKNGVEVLRKTVPPGNTSSAEIPAPIWLSKSLWFRAGTPG